MGAWLHLLVSRARARQQASAVHAPGEVRRSAFILSSPAPVPRRWLASAKMGLQGKRFTSTPFAGAERRAHQPWRARLCSSWPSLAHAPASGLRRLLAVPRGRRSPAAHGKSRWMRTMIQRPPRPTPRPLTGVETCGEGPRQKHRTPCTAREPLSLMSLSGSCSGSRAPPPTMAHPSSTGRFGCSSRSPERGCRSSGAWRAVPLRSWHASPPLCPTLPRRAEGCRWALDVTLEPRPASVRWRSAPASSARRRRRLRQLPLDLEPLWRCARSRSH